MKNKIIFGLCGAAALALATTAHATPNQDSIRFSIDGTTWLPADTFSDTDGDGVINATFTGNGFTLRVVTSFTYPFLGSQASPQMDLSVTGLTGTAGKSVWVEFSAMDFSPVPTGSYITTANSTVNGGSQSETTRIGNANALFAPGTSPGATFSTINLTGIGQTGTSSGAAPGQPSPYSITIAEVLTSTAGPGGLISTDDSLRVPDGGNTLMLLGSALSVLGFGVFRKSRKA